MNELLLTSPLAVRLYEKYAAPLPVIDFHNHLDPRDLAENRQYESITALWLTPDPYKHRAMRMCGVPELFITGDTDDREKFRMWCRVFPELVGAPVYLWSRMELEQVFGISLPLCEENADRIFDETREKLGDDAFRARGILGLFRAETVAPCTSLTGDLDFFRPGEGIVPSFRGDAVTALSASYADEIAAKSGIKITDTASFCAAVRGLFDQLHKAGCRFADHALDGGFRYIPDDGGNDARLARCLCGKPLTENDRAALGSHILRFLGGEYARRGWTMQLHIGAERFTSTRLRAAAGATGGFAGIGSGADMHSIVRLFDDIDCGAARLCHTVLFPLNPADAPAMSVLAGSFARDGERGLVTLGPAWWWCDHKNGIRSVLEANADFGLLSDFIGMTTDSRSLLSFVRHDYFRRILCSFLAEKANAGEYPDDERELARLIRKLCYENAAARQKTKTEEFR